MSKKVTKSAEIAEIAEAVEISTKSLKEYFEEYPNASLRKLAAATNINYGIMLKKSKEPVPNTVYDPSAINWAAVEAKLESKGINFHELDWDALNESSARKGSTLIKDMDAFQVGQKVFLRRNNTTPYEIVYKTATHVVLMLEGTSEPMAWSNNTFLINGPVFQPRTVSEKA